MNQLIYFISVVKNKNFTKAAEECHISQPAISQQIKELESSMGVELLKRHGRTFSVTPAGQYLYQHAQDLIESYNQLINQTKEIADVGSKEYVLNLGYLRDFGTQEFLQAVTKFSKQYPNVKVRIHSGNHEDLFQMIEKGQVDLNFSDLRRAPSNKYINDHLISSRFVVVASARLLSSKLKQIDSHELAEIPCVLVVGNSDKNSEVNYYREILGINSEFIFVGTYEEALVQVATGAGYLITNDRTSKNIADQSLIQLPLMNGRRAMIQDYYAFWKADNSGFYIEEFADILKKEFK